MLFDQAQLCLCIKKFLWKWCLITAHSSKFCNKLCYELIVSTSDSFHSSIASKCVNFPFITRKIIAKISVQLLHLLQRIIQPCFVNVKWTTNDFQQSALIYIISSLDFIFNDVRDHWCSAKLQSFFDVQEMRSCLLLINIKVIFLCEISSHFVDHLRLSYS